MWPGLLRTVKEQVASANACATHSNVPRPIPLSISASLSTSGGRSSRTASTMSGARQSAGELADIESSTPSCSASWCSIAMSAPGQEWPLPVRPSGGVAARRSSPCRGGRGVPWDVAPAHRQMQVAHAEGDAFRARRSASLWSAAERVVCVREVGTGREGAQRLQVVHAEHRGHDVGVAEIEGAADLRMIDLGDRPGQPHGIREQPARKTRASTRCAPTAAGTTGSKPQNPSPHGARG